MVIVNLAFFVSLCHKGDNKTKIDHDCLGSAYGVSMAGNNCEVIEMVKGREPQGFAPFLFYK
jgi:hypothetical protein